MDDSSIASQDIASQVDPDPLLEIEHELSILEVYSGPQKLVFAQSPQAPDSSSYIHPQDISRPNSGECSLLPDRQTNHAFLLVESRLCALLNRIRRMDNAGREERLRARIEHNLDILHSYKEMEWSSQRSGETRSSLHINSGRNFKPVFSVIVR